ncbi:MAG: hypothetical protein VXU50_06845 [Verrucomicrobiota bacterium]|nr:hypothetical protein [Verrucomicrobiota bacterium]
MLLQKQFKHIQDPKIYGINLGFQLLDDLRFPFGPTKIISIALAIASGNSYAELINGTAYAKY